MRIALYQPEIPQNTGTILRLAACLGLSVDLIGPYGFVWSDRHLKRAGMDYLDCVAIQHHASWEEFREVRSDSRLILLDVAGPQIYTHYSFQATDTLVVGKESTGVPQEIFHEIDNAVRIPLLPQRRSLNVAIAVAMVAGEVLRQTDLFPRV